MSHPERSRAKARDRPTRPERLGRKFGIAEHLEGIAGRIAKTNQFPDIALTGERARSAPHLYPGILQASGKTVEIGTCRNFPAHHAEAGIAAAVHDQPLLAVIHAEGADGAATV